MSLFEKVDSKIQSLTHSVVMSSSLINYDYVSQTSLNISFCPSFCMFICLSVKTDFPFEYMFVSHSFLIRQLFVAVDILSYY